MTGYTVTYGKYTVKYGKDGNRYRYVYSYERTLEAARKSCDSWLAAGANGGIPQAELRVWVEEGGKVVYGTAAKALSR